jgi:hypothetical protein
MKKDEVKVGETYTQDGAVTSRVYRRSRAHAIRSAPLHVPERKWRSQEQS